MPHRVRCTRDATPMRKRQRVEGGGTAARAREVVRTLQAAACESAPDPCYLDGQLGRNPLLTQRQREKVVKYINEVRA